MSAEKEVLDAATARAAALAAGDAGRLEALLHPDFGWTSHTGEQFDRSSYVEANTGGTTVWRGQSLGDAQVVVCGDCTAVLRANVTDEIQAPAGPTTFRMPMTQVWVRTGDGWQCLAGHAGPLLPA